MVFKRFERMLFICLDYLKFASWIGLDTGEREEGRIDKQATRRGELSGRQVEMACPDKPAI